MVRFNRAAAAAVALLWPATTLAQAPAATAQPSPAVQAQPVQPQPAQPAPVQPAPAQPTTGGVSYGQPDSGGYPPYQAGPVYRAPTNPDLPSRPAGDRVAGGRGSLVVTDSTCNTAGVLPATRRRLVALATGEWAAWGFPTLDLTVVDTLVPSGPDLQIIPSELNVPVQGRIWSRLNRLGQMEDDRGAVSSVGGYWAVTPGGSGMVSQQNRVWGASSNTAGWAQPWSAAFISWVACEAGLGSPAVFLRSDSHWNYIDQAIQARGGNGYAAYQAYDIGEAQISPGDMLCFSNADTPYRSIAERRAQLGRGFASHCDLVVKLDAARERVYLIGGNVAQAVTMTIGRATRRAPGGPLVPMDDRAQPGSRRWFAHLRLQAPPVQDDVMDQTTPIRNLRVLAASQGLLQPIYPALNNPPRVPPVAPAPTGFPPAAPQVQPQPAPAQPGVPAAIQPGAAAPVTSQPVPNPPGG